MEWWERYEEVIWDTDVLCQVSFCDSISKNRNFNYCVKHHNIINQLIPIDIHILDNRYVKTLDLTGTILTFYPSEKRYVRDILITYPEAIILEVYENKEETKIQKAQIKELKRLIAEEKIAPKSFSKPRYEYWSNYKVLQISSRPTLEHIYIMEQFLERKLERGENIHHKNGNRADNRVKNLELWNRPQPPGQRIKDKVYWAHEILDTHLPTFDKSTLPYEEYLISENMELGSGFCKAADCSFTIHDEGLCYQHTCKTFKIRINNMRVFLDGDISEHRFIMEQYIGRKLASFERVHHINNDLSDNRLSNLELWTTEQPKSGNIEDLLIFAKELLIRYQNLLIYL